MALLDDPSFIISHIRHSFITSDDTGMCEMVIMNEEVDHNSKKRELQAKKTTPWSTYCVPENDSVMEDVTIYNESYDIESSFDMGFRQRTNTAVRLEKLRRERKIQSQCKRVQWRENEQQLSAEDLNVLFAKKEVVPPVKSVKSALAVQLEQFPNQTNNPFSEYSKFDGKAHIGSGNVKKINIYFTMATADKALQPLAVYVLCSAKVLDLVGLLCWHYTNIGGAQEPLSENVESYCLMIAEEDGEVDTDFPALDNRELIARFGFPTLALVELNPKSVKPSQKTDQVVVNITSSDGASKIPLDNANITMREVLQKTLRRRKGIIPKSGPHYTLEKECFPGEKVDMDSTLHDMNTLNFVLVREHSKRESISFIHESPGNAPVTCESPLVLSSQYKSYQIQMLHRNVLRPPSGVDFGLSGEKIEIVPIMQQKTKTSKLWTKQKAYSISSDKLADCTIVSEGKSGKSVFRLVYLATSRDFKYHEFESKTEDIKEIVAKITQVLDLRSSQVRRDYLYLHSKKQQKKQEK
ncbi:target of rapamycin complex 2 subunit MAPKAP1-like isoform X2 [Anneissia japonica]|uniref:target of rapamycin complex 2 subunit MAPKAP1-like isoform X2 n=1 Tax=Anneissia japonica TaxID=1529436 RepID=UPI001425AB3F|nr:target of rapamycin complex 2 subunit MAPKAP1-like isoform X2 [Anneissia japonica]